MTITTLAILTAIRTSEWHRYSYPEHNPYATAGTSGQFSALDFRVWVSEDGTFSPYPIEYRRVGTDEWLPTGFQAIMRYDPTREHTEDSDGWEFIPYRITELSLTES